MQDELVTVGSYEFVSEAEVAQMHLQSQGITVFLRDAQILNMDWLLGNAIGYVKLQVPRAQEEAARQILSASPAVTEIAASHDDRNTCLSCGIALPADATKCPACGWSYARDQESLESPSQGAADKPDDDAAGVQTLGRFRSLKRPVFLLYLAPILFFLLLALRGLFEGLFNFIAR